MVSDAAQNSLIRRSILRGTASNYVGQGIMLAIGFVLTPFILHRVGATDYGLWVLISSFIGYGSLLEFGISGAVVKYTAEYRIRGASGEVSALVATALALYTVLGLLAIVLSLVAAVLLPKVLHIAPEAHAKAVQLILLSGVGLGISIPATTINAVLRGLSRFDLVNALTVGGTVLAGLATVASLLLGWGVVGLVAVGIPVTLVMQIPGILLVRRVAPELHLGWRHARRSSARTVGAFSLSLFVIQFAGRLQTQTDEIVIGTFLPVAAVTPYSFARRLGEMANLLTNQFIKVLMPVASELHAQSDWQRLRSLYTAGTRLALALSLVIGITTVVLARPILGVWVGPEYAGYWPLVLIITVSSIVVISLYPAGAILQGIARHKVLAISSIGSGLANLALSVALVGSLGLTGVALGTLIPTTIECLALVLPYSMRLLGVGADQMLKEVLVPAALPALPMIVVLYTLSSALQPASLFAVVGIASAGGLMYLAGYLAVGASASEREVVRTSVERTLLFIRAGFK